MEYGGATVDGLSVEHDMHLIRRSLGGATQVDPGVTPRLVSTQVDPGVTPRLVSTQVDPGVTPRLVSTQVDPGVTPRLKLQYDEPLS